MLLGGIVAACSSSGDGAGGASGGDCGSVMGAWEGSQLRGHDVGERFCMVFCGNARLFMGDGLCSDTMRSDFDEYHPWTCGEAVVVEGIAIESVVNGASITVSIDGAPFFQGNRVAQAGFCDDPNRTPRSPGAAGQPAP